MPISEDQHNAIRDTVYPFSPCGAMEEREIELPEQQTSDRRELLPGAAVLKDRRLAAHAGKFRP